jgi:diketogulonate reductase-like aldo/keto reductase
MPECGRPNVAAESSAPVHRIKPEKERHGPDRDTEQRHRDAPAGLRRFPDATRRDNCAVEAALAVGYRHVDTAAAYGNEREVGGGIRPSGLDRSDVFVETKVWISDYGYEETLHAFEKSAAKLRVEQIDLLILHQPLPTEFDRTVAAYKALETLLAAGKVRAIGVSNFLPEYLASLLAQVDVVPAINQIELHPYSTQVETRELNARHGILTQAWSPIGGITSYREGMPKRTFDDPTILDIADAHGKTAAQVMLRWHVQQGRSAPRTSTSSTSSSATPSSRRSTRSTRASAAAPSPRTSSSRTTAAPSPRHERAYRKHPARASPRMTHAVSSRPGGGRDCSSDSSAGRRRARPCPRCAAPLRARALRRGHGCRGARAARARRACGGS